MHINVSVQTAPGSIELLRLPHYPRHMLALGVEIWNVRHTPAGAAIWCTLSMQQWIHSGLPLAEEKPGKLGNEGKLVANWTSTGPMDASLPSALSLPQF